MPKELEEALMKSFSKKGAKLHGKDKKSMVYATMTNMQKKGEISPWRKLKKGGSKGCCPGEGA